MRILLSTIGSRGDVQPLVALGQELRRLGHEARYCVPPDFAAWIEGLGFHVTPIGPGVRATGKSAPTDMGTPEGRKRLAEGTVTAQFDAVGRAARDSEVVVAATALQLAARSVAEAVGATYRFAAYCPIVLPSAHHAPPPLPPVPGQPPQPPTEDNRELWARDTARFNALFGDALNTHRAALGLGRVEDVRSHILGERPWLAADAALAPWPESGSEDVFQTGAWLAEDERLLPDELERFLDAGEPPVYFGFGSIRAPEDLGGAMVEAAREVGRRAVVSRGWADLSPVDAERDCISIGDVSHQALFQRVAVVVHHGGAGTTTTAALAGAAQVVVPQLYDQHYWARRVDELGLGAAHARQAPTAASLTSALERALRPDVIERARSFATSVRRDGARVAAEALT